MALKNRPRVASGQILVHMPVPLALCRTLSPGRTSDSRKATNSCSVRRSKTSQGGGGGAREGREWCPGLSRRAWLDLLSHTSVSRLQAKFKSDHQELRAITQSILDTENGFVKDLEHFLHQQEWAELRRRELLHRRWTERVWSPVQRSVENRVSQRCDEEVQMSPRGMFLRYINHCNTKDFVFLENYNPKEYNPFLLNINRPHYYTVTTPILRDPLSLQSCERMKEKGAILCCQTVCVSSGSPVPVCVSSSLWLVIELQVQFNPNLPGWSLVQQQTTGGSTHVLHVLLYGRHWNRRSTQELYR